MSIVTINEHNRNMVVDLVTRNWGSAIMVTRGRAHDLSTLPGFLYMENNDIKGIISYNISDNECEVVLLESFQENQGIGSALLMLTIETAVKSACSRIWLITTNDNTKAIRFYQKKWFDLKAIYRNSIAKSRQLKPEIPLYGNDGIPILHEIEFEMRLNSSDSRNLAVPEVYQPDPAPVENV
ncbi:MAG TPA: GNAT family N-acetyltransferase [Clostridia bacterium]|nr:GNAT family N-acetyltransferase [Clostridia bacterium]